MKYPVKYVNALKEGGPHVILFSDGQKYVVKWKSGSKGKNEIVNEYVVGKLAELLSLPVIPLELVNMTEEFIKETPELQSNKKLYSPGFHYGCLFLENCLLIADLIDAPPCKANIVNRDMLAGILVFDQWVNNSDRNLKNLLLLPQGDGGLCVQMIDHGRCFPGRYRWSAQTLGQKPEYRVTSHIYRWIFSLLDNPEEELAAFVGKIIAFSNEWIEEVIQSVPLEWELSQEDREALYHFLVKQKTHLPDVIAYFRKVVPMLDEMNI